jgi:spore coat protein CotH
MRNLLAFNLFKEMGNYSIRAHLCEVLLDDSYRGIYLMGEKIRRDSGRVDIAKLTPNDTIGDALTGGYILQQNYWNENNSFLSNYSPIDHPEFQVHFVYEYPNENDILPVQKTYIASYIDSLETALYSDDFADPELGYRKYMDVSSFIDYFLVNEVSRNADGFKKSVFFHKDKYSNGGKLKAGPVWDFDWSFKNQEYCYFNNQQGEGWAHLINDCNVDNYSTGWYIRLLQDTSFQNELRCTYEEYRETFMDTTVIFAYMDSIASLLENAQARHFQRWSLLGHNGPDWELEPFADNYNEELVRLKNWISTRITWLDVNIPGFCAPVGVDETTLSGTVKCYPNPASNYFIIDYSLPSAMNVSVRLYNYLGSEVLTIAPTKQSTGQHLIEIDTKNLPSGIYILKFERGKDVISKKITVVK